MQVGHFPASAANSLIEGYCDDFVSLAAILAQTLEQVSMRGICFDASRPSLERIEKGMRDLASAIHELLERAPAPANVDAVAPKPAAPAPTPARPTASSSLGHAGASPMAQGPMPPRAPSPRSSIASTPPPATGAKPPTPTPARRATPQPPPPPQGAPTRPTPSAAAPARSTPPPVQRPQPPFPPNGEAAPARRAAKPEGLRGTNRTMPLQSVFQFLGRMRKSGTLHVFVGDEILAFEFVNGCIEFTATNRCPINERLGELLVELGFCTRDDLAPFLAKVGVSSANRLGQLVVESKLVSNGQVLEALEAQVLLRFQRVCASGDASYEFEAGPRAPGDGRIRIAPFELTIDQPWKLRTP